VVNALLDEMEIATVHGRAFGIGPYIRIAYALDEASLSRAWQRYSGFL
jgi:aspartate aminotransferase